MAEGFQSARVRREDVLSPSASPRSTPDPELQGLLRSRLHDHFTFTFTTATDADLPDAGHVDASDQDETELRLFANPASAGSATLKIRLSSPGAGSGEPSLAVKRPRSYYFADAPTGEDERRLQAAAMDGSTVLELADQPWPGCTLPWKVTTISAAGLHRNVLVGHARRLAHVLEPTHKRVRKGKKTRIAVRKRTQAAKDRREEQARVAQQKEEAEREKRTRRNREKKLKKKAKSQAKKVEDPAPRSHEST
ncbi:hypothetical protein BDU57DRAFT_555690 [Ampelomyces quisqualis]|uniref:Uncharacterized protein n=1 Tax=Ampelomyces quisqualis TaxID=50730 RepID=A0A6A5QQF5_AMPQU|nr:hypothetical protein BDU57DRAFT_555690 [Ampelomyces quisqualis]